MVDYKSKSATTSVSTYSSCSKANSSWRVLLLLSNPQDLHPYSYTANNPVNHTDPQGLTANTKVYVNRTRLTCNWPFETPINICVYSCEYCYEIDCHGEKVNFKDNCVKIAMGNPGVI